MAPLTGAAKAAIEDFFGGRRGTRNLHPDVRAAMAAYFVGKGLTVPELPTAWPSAPDLVLEWRRARSGGTMRSRPPKATRERDALTQVRATPGLAVPWPLDGNRSSSA